MQVVKNRWVADCFERREGANAVVTLHLVLIASADSATMHNDPFMNAEGSLIEIKEEIYVMVEFQVVKLVTSMYPAGG